MSWSRRMLRNRICIDSPAPQWPHVAILAGVHGNERVGYFAFEKLLRLIWREPLVRGKLSLIAGNIAATDKRKPTRTAQGQDMNRLFDTNERLEREGLRPAGEDWKRAQQITAMLQDVDVLLDLHSTTTPSEPFAIVRDLSPQRLALLEHMPISRIDYAYPRVLPGCSMQAVEDSFSLCKNPQPKYAMTVECGQHSQASTRGAQVAYRCAVALLRNLSMLANPHPARGSNSLLPRKRIEYVVRGVVRHPASLRYTKGIRSGTTVPWSSIIAWDNTGEYRVPSFEQSCEITGKKIQTEGLEIIMVTPGSRLTNVRPHDAYVLGLSFERDGETGSNEIHSNVSAAAYNS